MFHYPYYSGGEDLPMTTVMFVYFFPSGNMNFLPNILHAHLKNKNKTQKNNEGIV